MPPRWKNYSQVLPRKILERFTLSSVSKVVLTAVLRQDVYLKSCRRFAYVKI